MKRITIGLALLLALACTCLAQAKSDPREAEIRKLFMELDQSAVKHDEAAGSNLLHDEYTFVNPGGTVMNKERFVKSILAGNTVYEEHKTEDLALRFFGMSPCVKAC